MTEAAQFPRLPFPITDINSGECILDFITGLASSNNPAPRDLMNDLKLQKEILKGKKKMNSQKISI
eukprot:4890393-Amphidinium_carterae.1